MRTSKSRGGFATRWRSPPERRSGACAARAASLTQSSARRARQALAARNAAVRQPVGDVLQRARPGDQHVVLEDEAEPVGAQRRQRRIAQGRRRDPGDPHGPAGGTQPCAHHVVLPGPDGQTMETRSPSSIVRLTSRRASTGDAVPYRLWTSWSAHSVDDPDLHQNLIEPAGVAWTVQ